MQKLKSSLMWVGALILLLGGFLVFERIRGKIGLERCRDELIAAGEKWSAADLASAGSRGENCVSDFTNAAGRLVPGKLLPDEVPPAMSLMESGRAIAWFREAEWVEGRETNRWEDIAAELAPNEAGLEQIAAALSRTNFNNELDYSQGFKMMLPQLLLAKRLTSWFGPATQLALREGRTRDAADFLVAEIRLCRVLKEDRLAISELVRVAIASISFRATWEALQADGWSDEDLAGVQQAWEENEFAASVARSLEGERVFMNVSYDLYRRSNSEANDGILWEDLFRFPGVSKKFANACQKHVYTPLWRFAWLDQDQRRTTEEMQTLIETARTASTGKAFTAIKPDLDRFIRGSTPRNWYDRLRYPGLESRAVIGRVVERGMKAETERSMVIGAIALKRYSLRHGSLPSSLESLVPDYLPSLPIDYMDGKPLRYRLDSDQTFCLYSIGLDGVDDHGDAAPEARYPKALDFWKRKDFVWPMPALPDEVESYWKTVTSE